MDWINSILDLVVPTASLVMLAFAWPTLSFLRACERVFRTFYIEDMEDKVVVITGASSGIGEQIAYEYAKKGANLVLVARRENRLRGIRENCRLLGASQVLVIASDVVKEEDCRRFIGDTVSYFGHLDYLVNTASLGHTFLFEEATDTSVFPHMMVPTTGGHVAEYAKMIVSGACRGDAYVKYPSWMDLAQYKLDGNADAVEFCPYYPYHNVLAAATYTLEEGTQPNRSGSITLFSICPDLGGIELLQKVETAGIFDIKWRPIGNGSNPILAQADAAGCLSLYSLEPTSGRADCGAMLNAISAEKVSSSMCLSLDWNPSSTNISLGLSDGSISVVTLVESQLCLQDSWKAHEYEVWYTHFDPHEPQLLYTGSDDSRLCCWDLRESPTKLVFENKKSHKMGVCCIAKSPSNSNMLLTGSYDESLRVWDVRETSRPVIERSIGLGGGVWRIKHHPDNYELLLAACMHNGFAILKTTEEGFTVVENYKKHESLAYGADWQRGGDDGSKRQLLVATCSFYDRLVRVWLPESLLPK